MPEVIRNQVQCKKQQTTEPCNNAHQCSCYLLMYNTYYYYYYCQKTFGKVQDCENIHFILRFNY